MLLAVHIGERMLALPWCAGGFALGGLLVLLATWRLREDEVPRLALLTAALFISSSMHVPVGPASVHLLLNGLAGVLLGWRCSVAIAVALFLQAVLLQHGGYAPLGVNLCVQAIPALLAGGLYHALHRRPSLRHPVPRALLVGTATLLWLYAAGLCVLLLAERITSGSRAPDYDAPAWQLLHPVSLAIGVVISAVAIALERRLEARPEFPLGLLVGVASVLLTILLNAAVLLLGGEQVGEGGVLALVLAHLPVAAIEGIVLGFTVGYLARVKPALLERAPRPEPQLVASGTGNTSSSATSH